MLFLILEEKKVFTDPKRMTSFSDILLGVLFIVVSLYLSIYTEVLFDYMTSPSPSITTYGLLIGPAIGVFNRVTITSPDSKSMSDSIHDALNLGNRRVTSITFKDKKTKVIYNMWFSDESYIDMFLPLNEWVGPHRGGAFLTRLDSLELPLKQSELFRIVTLYNAFKMKELKRPSFQVFSVGGDEEKKGKPLCQEILEMHCRCVAFHSGIIEAQEKSTFEMVKEHCDQIKERPENIKEEECIETK